MLCIYEKVSVKSLLRTIMNTLENVYKDRVLEIDVVLILCLGRTSMKGWKYLRILLEGFLAALGLCCCTWTSLVVESKATL